MNLVTVFLKVSPQVLQFHFDKYADALSARDALLSGGLIEDDYGSKAKILVSEIAGIVITDLSREMRAHEEVDCEKMRKDMRVQRVMQAEQSSGIAMPRHLMGNS